MTSDGVLQFDERRIYSLSEVALSVKEAIQITFPDAYWIKAEIAKLNYYYKSGHCYLDLVEKQDRTLKAEMRATLWAGNYQMITAKFRKVTREELHDGMMILFLATISFHELYGLSLNIIDIEPSFTLGEMARDKRDAIERLKAEGIFDLNKKLEIPLIPKRLAIISIDSSKGYIDLITTLDNNPFRYAFIRELFPAILQGDNAVSTIRAQLKQIASEAGRFDAVMIIRGGGGEVGLSAYDHYELAAGVARCPLPVITGIGHSTNETVTEMVAHTNLITPTAVANFLIQRFREFDLLVDELKEQIIGEASAKLEMNKEGIGKLAKACQLSTIRVLQRHQLMIANFTGLIRVQSRQFIVQQSLTLESAGKRLALLDPVNVLKRGYSITYFNGRALIDATLLQPGDEIHTRLHKGSVDSTVNNRNNQSL